MQSLVLVFCLIVRILGDVSNHTLDEDIEDMMYEPSKLLSRRRRYLIYPEDSSFQLVVEIVAGSYIGVADIFYLGATSALAWPLPSEPWHRFRKKKLDEDEEEGAMEKIDGSTMDMNGFEDQSFEEYPVQKNILINRYTGKPIQPIVQDYQKKINYEKEYRKHQINLLTNPALSKRSIQESNKKKTKNKRATVMKMDRKAMHKSQTKRRHLNTKHMPPDYIEYHRKTSSSLYEKIERLLRGMGSEGRECVLKSICEIGQGKDEEQGSFLDEIMRAIFTLHPGDEFESQHHRAYDEAYASKENCSEKYSKCTSSLKTMPLR